MSTHIEIPETREHPPVRDLVVGAVSIALLGTLLLGLAYVVKLAVELVGAVAID